MTTHTLAEFSSGDPGTLELTNAHLNGNDGTAKAGSFAHFGVRYNGWDANDEWRMVGRGATTAGSRLSLEFYDDSAGNRTEYLNIEKGGPMRVRNADLRLATGQAIERGNGNEVVDMQDNFITFNDDSGTKAFEAKSGEKNSIHARSGQPIVFDDQEGGFQALKYTTADSTPGTLELTNATLDISENSDIPFSIDKAGISAETQTLSDDEASRFSKVDGNGGRFAFVEGGDRDDQAFYHFEYDGFTTIYEGSGFNNASPGTLSGTDGADGQLNVSHDGNNVYVENRTGNTIDVTIIRIGNV